MRASEYGLAELNAREAGIRPSSEAGPERPYGAEKMTEPAIVNLDAVWRDVVDVCDGLTADQWRAATDCPGWNVHDNVAHMIGTERMLMGEQASAAPEAGEKPYVRNDIGKANEQWIETYRHWDGPKLLDEFRAVTARRLDQLRALTPDDWDREGFTPEGPGPYRQFMEIRVFDCWYHDQDIREAINRPGLLEGAVADASLERIVRKALGYVVGKKASTPPNSTVVFDVHGTPPITATVSVPPEGRATLVADVPASPTAHITLDRRTFSRLAGGRWTGEQARSQGTVAVAGDADLANRIVDNMSFTI
jgi:uncharacterized protein (TIGR03083 family)